MGLYLGAQRTAGPVAVVGCPEGDRAEAAAKQAEAILKPLQFIEVDQRHPETIAEPVLEALDALVHDLPEVEAGRLGDGGRPGHAASVSRPASWIGS